MAFLYPYGDSQQLNLSWFLAKFKELYEYVMNLDPGESSMDTILSRFTEQYNPSTTYTAGDYCIFDGYIYKANRATSGMFDSGSWDAALPVNDIQGLRILISELSRTVEDIGEAAVTDVQYTPGAAAADGVLKKTINGADSTVMTVDKEPTENSQNPVKSGSVYDELSEIKGSLTHNENATNVNPYIKSERLISHQGGTYPTASTDLAFEFAISQGFKILEGDIQITSDKEFVIWHDTTYNGLTIKSSTLASLEASTLSDGSKLISFDDFIQMCLRYSVCGELDLTHLSDINVSTYAETLYNKIAPYIDSFYFTGRWAQLNYLINIDPTIILCISNLTTMSQFGSGVTSMCQNSRYPMISQAYDSINSEIVEWCREHGVQVKGYTTTTEAQAISAFLNDVDKLICESITPKTFSCEDYTDDIIIYDSRIEFLNMRLTKVSAKKLNNIVFLTIPYHLLKTTLTADQTTIATLPEELRPISNQIFMGARYTNRYANASEDVVITASQINNSSDGTTINVNILHGGYKLDTVPYGFIQATYLAQS